MVPTTSHPAKTNKTTLMKKKSYDSQNAPTKMFQ